MQRLQQSAYKLGSEAVLTLVLADEAAVEPIFEQLWSQIDAFEQRFSRFRPESELSAFNASAGETVEVSPEFRALLATAYDWAEQTDGLYTPFILPSLQQAGYKGSWPAPQNLAATPDFSGRSLADWRPLSIGRTTAAIPASAALDFGGIGKGYLLDQLADSMPEEVTGYWLSLGGDIVSDGSDADGSPWQLSVQAALDPHATVQRASTGGRLALATSGVTKRAGTTASGQHWHHLIDPRTGQPATTDVLTASIAARSATIADVLAKVCVLSGSRSADRWAQGTGVLGGVVQYAEDPDTVQLKQIGTIWSTL